MFYPTNNAKEEDVDGLEKEENEDEIENVK